MIIIWFHVASTPRFVTITDMSEQKRALPAEDASAEAPEQKKHAGGSEDSTTPSACTWGTGSSGSGGALGIAACGAALPTFGDAVLETGGTHAASTNKTA